MVRSLESAGGRVEALSPGRRTRAGSTWGYSEDPTGYLDPSAFIRRHR